jgi:NADPH:quinone reductase-like Zn-dependent oxidoreductase
VDYTRGPIDDAIREPVDLIVNLAPTGEREITRLLALLRPGGVLVSATGPADEEEAKRLGVRTVRMGVQPNAQQLREIAALVDAGKLKPIITARVPVSALADAHRRIGQTYGKVLVTAP